MAWHLSGYYLDVSEAALQTGLSGRRIRQACLQRELAAIALPGGQWLIEQADLRAWRASARPPGRPKSLQSQ